MAQSVCKPSSVFNGHLSWRIVTDKLARCMDKVRPGAIFARFHAFASCTLHQVGFAYNYIKL